MLSPHRLRQLGLGLAVLVLSLGLVACSGDEPLAPSVGGDESNAGDPWQLALDEIRAQEDGPELLAALEPHLAEVQRQFDDAALKHDGARLFVAVERTEITFVPPFPPPLVNLEIDYDGVGTVVGRHTGFSPLTQDITVFPFVQWGEMTFYPASGGDLVCDFVGTSVPGEEVGDVVFDGDITFSGGSGRFAGATGSGHYAGTANEISATGSIVWWGILDLDD